MKKQTVDHRCLLYRTDYTSQTNSYKYKFARTDFGPGFS